MTGQVGRRARPETTTLLAVLVAALLTLAACGSDDTTGTDDSAPPSGDVTPGTDGIAARDWVLQADGTSFTLPPNTDITFRVDGAEASGSSGCNSYTATVQLEPSDAASGTIALGEVASTMMACAEPEKNDAEAAFQAALGAIDEFEVDGDRLVLRGGDTTLTFAELADVPEPSADVLVGTWLIDSIAEGNTVSSALAGTEPTITFEADGTLTLDTGCNTGGGSWELDGTTLTVPPLRLTLVACEEPEGASAQEAAILASLEQPMTVQVLRGGVAPEDVDSMLSLLDSGGALLLGMSRQP